MRINYDTHVLCSHCAVKHLKAITELVYGYGYKCPLCGRKCRTKAKDTSRTITFEPCGRLGRSAIRREILAIAQETRME